MVREKRRVKGMNCEERIRDIISCPDNKDIPRHIDAGKIINGSLVMHNGLKIPPRSYCGDFSKIFELNKGVHEPQEEKVFAKVLPYVKQGGVIIELGSYWSFYSMWFNKEVKNAKCFMVEPDKECLGVGERNFKLNNLTGDFTLGKIGINDIKLDEFVTDKKVKEIDVLHADIQGAEFEMLTGAEKLINEGKIKYFFISTHSQELHYKCLNFLKKHGYTIIASADFDKETYSHDGVLVARLTNIDGCGTVDIALANWKPFNSSVYKLYLLSAKLKEKSEIYRRFIKLIKKLGI